MQQAVPTMAQLAVITQPDPPGKEGAEYMSNAHENEDLESAKDGTTVNTNGDAPPTAPGSEMDGRRAWIQLLASHLIIFNTWGYLQTYGVFQSYYVETLEKSASAISWVGSVQIFLLYIVGPISGRLADAGYYPQIFASGTAILLVGVFTTSVATQYWQLFLAQGICTGLGCGIIFCPSLSILATYFNKRRATAIGIAATGAATGGIVYPLVVQQLLPKIGFGWTMRILGFIMLATMILPCILSRARLPPRKKGPLVDWAAFKEPCFPIYWVAISLCFWGVYFPYYYVSKITPDPIVYLSSTDRALRSASTATTS
jgi:MFS family permease